MATLLVALIPAAAFGTPAAQQRGNFMVSVAGTAGSIPHLIDLKVTQLPGGQLSEVTGFIVGPEDVVQVKQGENLIVSTSPDLMTNKVTVRNMQGIPIDLVPLPSNVWSLQGLLPGVYTLDVIADTSSSGILGTYETMLVILEPNQQPLPPSTIISQITVEESAVCPPNLILVNGNCVERTSRICLPYEGPGGCNYPPVKTPKPPLPSYPGPTPRPTDDCKNDPSTPPIMCPEENGGEDDDNKDESISPEFSGNENDTPEPDEPEEDEVSNPDDDDSGESEEEGGSEEEDSTFD